MYANTIRIGLEGRPLRTLPMEASSALTGLALRNSVTYGQAIGVALINQNYLNRIIDEGSEVLIKQGSSLRHIEYK